MTRRVLARWVMAIMIYLGLLIVLGLRLSDWGRNPDANAYRVFKDLIPLLIAVPAAWLGALFQKRASFLSSLRILYEMR
jgi:hypothetical protein